MLRREVCTSEVQVALLILREVAVEVGHDLIGRLHALGRSLEVLHAVVVGLAEVLLLGPVVLRR
eukprot:13028767-Alexandrium_andersonii.AAC.1